MLAIDNPCFETEYAEVAQFVAYSYEDYFAMELDAAHVLGYWTCEDPFVFFDAIRAVDTTDRLVIYDFYDTAGTLGTKWIVDNIDPLILDE